MVREVQFEHALLQPPHILHRRTSQHEVRDEDREGLKALCRVQYHHAVTPEVQRALAAAPRRGAAPPPATALRAVEDPGKLPPVELMEDD